MPFEAADRARVQLLMQMKKAKLFKNGQSQAVRLPKEFRFEGSEVHVKRVGNAVVLLPLGEGWVSLADSLALFSDDFMKSRDQPDEQQEREHSFR